MLIRLLRAAAAACIVAMAGGAIPAAAAPAGVLTATLANGLRVAIVRNPLAPVVSTNLTYLVGSRDDPPDVPGMAHAQEHMLFRGTAALTGAQLGTIATALGGAFNAGTTDVLTQYQFTIPAADLDAILRIEADRMGGVLDLDSEWANERGAIEQEVARDESVPGRDFFQAARARAYAGTGYAHDGVGTKAAFDALRGARMKAFHDRWYAPNNALLVIAGDVEPAATLARVRRWFEAIPRRNVPAHAVANLRPLTRTVIRRESTLIYPLAAVGYRLPGILSADFLASYVLQGILGSDAGPLHALEDAGAALTSSWDSLPYVPEGQIGFALVALPPGGDPLAMTKRLETILARVARDGVSRDLFERTRRRLIVEQEESRNSIEALASDWATTLALDNEPSIEREQELIAAVTLTEVNRVAKRYLDPAHAIVGALTPGVGASADAAAGPAAQARENPLGVQPVVAVPEWAQPLVRAVSVPPATITATTTVLPNGITLVVQPESISNAIFVYGSVRNVPVLQEPAGKEGLGTVVNAMFASGTQRLDRRAMRRALDDAQAQLSAGYDFGLQTTTTEFERGVALLAENELHPRLDGPSFELERRRVAEQLATALTSSHTIAMTRADRALLPPYDPVLREPTPATVNALQLADVQGYYAQTFRPDLATIVVIGNVTPERARGAIERAFGGWHANGATPALELGPVPPNGPNTVQVPIPGSQAVVTLLETVATNLNDPLLPGLELGNAILGGGSVGPQQSRLFRELRQNSGLVYAVDSQMRADQSRGRFTVEFASAPQNAARIVAAIELEIQKLRTEPAGESELALMKASLVRQSVIRDSAILSIGGALLGAAANGRPLDDNRRHAQRLLATDAATIQRAFAERIDPRRFVRVVEGP